MKLEIKELKLEALRIATNIMYSDVTTSTVRKPKPTATEIIDEAQKIFEWLEKKPKKV